MPDLAKQYDPAAAQARWYRFWELRGYFHSEPDPAKRPFCIVIPPPNVTGALHLGHALNNTLQDILIRQKRMQGFAALWMPGTDHAGIATQAVVERRLLQEEKLSRHQLGREGLVERIWQWKNDYEKRILGQLKEMGCSCDWQRTRFTLDPQCAQRGAAHVLQDVPRPAHLPRQAAGELGHDAANGRERRRGLSRDGQRPLLVLPLSGDRSPAGRAGARDHRHDAPETMLGDTAVAVHPEPAAALDKAEAELQSAAGSRVYEGEAGHSKADRRSARAVARCSPTCRR